MGKISKILSVIAVLVMTGCAGQFYGFSEDEWSKLSDREKQVAKENYAELIEEKNHYVNEDDLDEQFDNFMTRNLGKHWD